MASLVYHAGALGDFITTLPAIHAWRVLHPGEPHVLLGRPAFAQLVQPPFDAVQDASSAASAALFSSPGPGEPTGAGLLVPVSSALLFAAPSSPLPAALAARRVREIVRQDPFPPVPVHVVDWHLSLFGGRAFGAEERMPRVRVVEEQDPAARGAVVLHPGSGSPRKNWPWERFVALSRWLMEGGQDVAWVLGEAEAGVSPPPDIRAWRCVPLPRLAGLLARSRLFIGNDSGVAHLAAAAGCPVVALFAESDPRVWAPRGRCVRVIVSEGGGMEGISLDSVRGMIREMLDLVS